MNFLFFALLSIAVSMREGIVTSPLALHTEGSTESPAVTIVPKGASVEVLETENKMSYIKYNGVHGFVLAKYIDFAKPMEILDTDQSKKPGALTEAEERLISIITANDSAPKTLYRTAPAAERGSAILPDVKASIAYAELYYKKPNHICGDYLDMEKTTYPYFGNSVCGYQSNGGDDANFVSQILIAGGHTKLTETPCRGASFKGIEPTNEKLYSCLTSAYGWKSAGCSMFCKMPENVSAGDLVFFRQKSCALFASSHIAFVHKAENGMAYIASHSEDRFDFKYTRLFATYPYCEFLMRNL